MNLHIWGKIETPNCQLCARKGSLQHILSSCPKALGDGRYRWRHDQVLKVIANEVTKAMRASKHQPGKKLKQINFVKAGEKIQRKRREKTNLLSSADDWQLILFTNPSARAGYDTRSIFKRSLTDLNSEFSFS